jgi:phosphopantothenoylcysteine decarboxylase / phosphopantothenate---cysteine ligase
MSSLNNKRILLGVTGGIAAYKSAELIRRLTDAGAEIQVVMTAASQEFITPLTLQALSGNPVHTDLLDPTAEAGMGHIQLARWADLLVVAPATADFMARLTQGMANDLLTSICLATKAPLVLAPAMNQGMWNNSATQENLHLLQSRGIKFLGPDSGIQACGDIGMGRMQDVDNLVAGITNLFMTGTLAGKTVVITAGPTREAIDPVRYLSNHSSGKMGYALAQAAAEAGATVTLISGPTHLPCPERVKRLEVVSAQEMYDACLNAVINADIFIAAAAVADYRPAEISQGKIKKNQHEDLMLHLVKNPDILANIAKSANRPRFVMGFAAETHQLIEHAQDKLLKKNLDMVAANNVSSPEIGFNSDDNQITLITASQVQELPRTSKMVLAQMIIARIADALNKS